MRRRIAPLTLACALVAASAFAHPAPFSYLDLYIDGSGVKGTLVVHDLDAAHELGITDADSLLVPEEAARRRDALVAVLGPRLSLTFDGQPARIEWGAIDVVADRQSLRLAFTASESRPGHIQIQAYLFPYDPIHQTFVNIYEDTALRLQLILDAAHQNAEYYSGSTQGRLAVVKTFIVSGIEHIMIGPDHILFLIGLLLLGGTLSRLALIVTSFTVGDVQCPAGGGDGTVSVMWATDASTAVRLEVDGTEVESAAPSGSADVAVPCDGADHEVAVVPLSDTGAGQPETETVSSG